MMLHKIPLRHWIALASLGFVIWLVVMDLDSTSPGPLAPAHAGLSELEGIETCQMCHDAQERRVQCGVCHNPIYRDIEQRLGLHGGLQDALAQDCAECHLEHLSGDPPLVGTFAFERSGFRTRDDFDHGAIGFDMRGRHTEAGCAACHEEADALVLQLGLTRFRGLDPGCVACHEDPHDGGLKDCIECHAPTHAFSELTNFQHDERWPLVGEHAGLSCQDCHAPDSAYDIDKLRLTEDLPGRSCADCHEHPHRADFLSALAADLPAPGYESDQHCAPCHMETDRSFKIGDEESVLRGAADWHTASGFKLVLPHAELACSECHTEDAHAAGSFSLLGANAREPRSAEDCRVCHIDPHGGQFASGGVSAGTDCRSCHLEQAFHPHTFDLTRHAATAFPLQGSHTAVACNHCHTEVHPQSGRQFAATLQNCADCHRDVHDWSQAYAEAGADCEQCHLETRFNDLRPASFEHAPWTAFALSGAHADAACETCHIRSASPDADGRSFGRILAQEPLHATDCENCHSDAHRGAFDELPGLLAEGVDGSARDCELCHTTSDFHETPDFDHGRHTSFPLDGAHAATDCRKCHIEQARQDPIGRSFGWIEATLGAKPGACDNCHTDVHAGIFDRRGRPKKVAGRTSCARCHDSDRFDHLIGASAGGPLEENWSLSDRFAPFEHSLWTDFELLGPHVSLRCTDCHQDPKELNSIDGTHTTRMSPAAGSKCAECHSDPHAGQFLTASNNDCSRCHVPSANTFQELSFDHDSDSRFELDELHAALACDACHQPSKLKSGQRIVRYKPLGTSCAECHVGTVPVGESSEEGGR